MIRPLHSHQRERDKSTKLVARLWNPRLIQILWIGFVGVGFLTKLPVEQASAKQPAAIASLQFNVQDDRGKPLPCRIHLRSAKGKPIRATGQPFWHDHWVCDGQVAASVPAGTYRWQIERGPEYRRQTGEVVVTEDHAAHSQTLTQDVTLSRLTDLRSDGWYSGDLHVHRAVEEIPLHLRAEDLDFAPTITWWNQRNLWKERQIPLTTTRKTDDGRYMTIMGGEDEREGGALLFFGLEQPLDLDSQSREFPSPMKFVAEARTRNGQAWIDIEKPFWWDTPTWLAVGEMDSVGIANNHMCRSQMLENEAWGRARDTTRLPSPRGNGLWTQEIYYHALDAGLRIPPSAGSASGVLPNPVGYNRVYVHLDANPNGAARPISDNEHPNQWVQRWFEGLRSGRCFVTNGPLLRVTANESLPGKTFQLNGAHSMTLELSIQCESNDPMSAIEVIHNGHIVHTFRGTDLQQSSHSVDLIITEPGWLLVRAIADVPETFRFASTAPWYFETKNVQRRISKASASFFLDWIDERTDRIRQSVTEIDRLRPILEPHHRARTFWLQQAELANAQADGFSPIPSTSKPHSNDLKRANEPQGENVASPSGKPSRQTPTAIALDSVEPQPLLASIDRLIAAMEHIGAPLPESVATQIESLRGNDDAAFVTREVQRLLDQHALLHVVVNRDAAPLVSVGQAKRQLLEQGWKTFLVKVINPAEWRGRLVIGSPNAQPLPHSPPEEVDFRWLRLATFEGQPMRASLSGLGLEYRILQLYSRDPGPKEAVFGVSVSGNTSPSDLIQSWRFSNEASQWNANNQIKIDAQDGSLKIESLGNDPFMSAPVKANAGAPTTGPMVLRFWASTDEDGMGQVFWWTQEQPRADGGRRENFLVEGGRGHLYEVPFHVDGKLTGVRIDPLSKTGKMQIDWIDLCTPAAEGARSFVPLSFSATASTPVTFRVHDAQGDPAIAKFVIRDRVGQIYPAQSKRLAPDFFFQKQIYRGDGETINLPPGDYTVTCSRGPETIEETKSLRVTNEPTEIRYRVKRWIDPSQRGWWSGDHHIHAAGCRHYENPTQGVAPNDMIRHIMGEDLKVGCCLTWGPCFDFQKRFFTGETAEQSRYPYLLRYDVEVSGFGSHMSGHLNLLNLQEQIYPGGESKEHWPTLGLNTLRWAKRQGGICGPAHSAIGLTKTTGRLPNSDGLDGPNGLPNFEIPRFDGIGANEFIVDVTHRVPGADGDEVPAVDFISAMSTQRTAEWNIWYHTLNCGFRVAASGETDFPCLSGERVGVGRVYAQVDGDLRFDRWVESLANGRSYVSDGTCHLLDFQASSRETVTRLGINGSELQLSGTSVVEVAVDVAARLNQGDAVPIAKSVPVEVVVNGYPVDSVRIPADGEVHRCEFQVPVEQSSWIAIRVFPHAHTNPIYAIVDQQPIRTSAASARWCLAGVEQCWQSKESTYDESEQQQAIEAYHHARQTYRRIADEAERAARAKQD